LSEELSVYYGQAGWVAPSISVAALFYNIVALFQYVLPIGAVFAVTAGLFNDSHYLLEIL
jgi:hypothetical protein